MTLISSANIAWASRAIQLFTTAIKVLLRYLNRVLIQFRRS